MTRCCTRKYAAQSLVRPAKFEPVPSCVCRWDTSVVQQWNVSYAYHPTLLPHREKGPHGSMFRRPTGLKIDLKTETATQPRCLEAIPCSAVESKNPFQKTEHKSDTFGRGFFARVSPVGRDGRRLGFLDLDCGVNKSAANYWRGLDETAPAGGS